MELDKLHVPNLRASIGGHADSLTAGTRGGRGRAVNMAHAAGSQQSGACSNSSTPTGIRYQRPQHAAVFANDELARCGVLQYSHAGN